MAITGATVLSSVAELIQTEYINTFVADACGNYKNPSQFLLPIQVNNGANTVSQTRWDSAVGTVPEDGAAVDTEFDAVEATELTAIEMTTADSTFTIAEYGLLREPSDTVMEDATLLTFNAIISQAVDIMMAAMNDDVCALFASFSASAGTSGVNCRVADVDDALYDLNRRGVRGEAVGVFDIQARDDFMGALQEVSTNAAAFASTADRLMGVSAPADGGRNAEGLFLRYKNTDFYQQQLCDTANSAADVVSAIFVRGDIPSQQTTAALGKAEKRPFTLKVGRNEPARCTELVFTARWGCGIINNQMGCKLVTDA